MASIQLCLHLDLGILATRVVQEHSSVVLSHQVCGHVIVALGNQHPHIQVGFHTRLSGRYPLLVGTGPLLAPALRKLAKRCTALSQSGCPGPLARLPCCSGPGS